MELYHVEQTLIYRYQRKEKSSFSFTKWRM